MEYIYFVLRERKALSFGLSFTFFSSFGQTFLISLFVPFFLADFNLSNAAFGTIYSSATLMSAMSLPYLGKWIDDLPIKQYSLYVIFGLLTASITVAFSWHIAFLFAGILMLRLSGQGLSSHTAETAMARYFPSKRGKALSISSLGYPLGEGILPLAVASLLAVISWRMTWGVIAAVIALFFIPFILFVSSRFREKEDEKPIPSSTPKAEGVKSSVYRDLLLDRTFLLILPAALLPAFWATALFLYQVSFAEQLGWSAAIIASAFVSFAGGRIISSLGVGPLVDKLSAKKIFPFHLIPLGAALLVAYLHPGIWSAFLYMALFGTTMGMGNAIKSALWAELYGSEMIGRVRSLYTSLMVFATSLSPFIVGWLLDWNVSISAILLMAMITVTIGTMLAFVGLFKGR